MKKFIAPPIVSQSAVVQTKTLTTSPAGGAAMTDSLVVTTAFVVRPAAIEGTGSVEEDSTDIYTLERCSPLNDF